MNEVTNNYDVMLSFLNNVETESDSLANHYDKEMTIFNILFNESHVDDGMLSKITQDDIILAYDRIEGALTTEDGEDSNVAIFQAFRDSHHQHVFARSLIEEAEAAKPAPSTFF